MHSLVSSAISTHRIEKVWHMPAMLGALPATGQYLAFVDQDDEVGDGSLSAMGDALSRHDFVGCAIDFQKLNEPWLQKIRGGGQSRAAI